MSPFIDMQRDDQIATITFDRPHARNAVTFNMLQALEHVLTQLHQSPPRAVILRATGTSFCAGVDLKESGETVAEFAHRRVSLMHRVLGLLRDLPVPVVAAIHGACVGLGCELAISADLRFATADSRFRYPEPMVAVPSPAHRLMWLIGLSHTQDMLLTARWVDATEAQEWGLLTRIVDDVDRQARETVAHILALAPVAVAETKENIRLSLTDGVAASADHHIHGVTTAASSNDRREALAAFAEKRDPRFTGT